MLYGRNYSGFWIYRNYGLVFFGGGVVGKVMFNSWSGLFRLFDVRDRYFIYG